MIVLTLKLDPDLFDLIRNCWDLLLVQYCSMATAHLSK